MFDDIYECSYKFKEIYNKQNIFDDKFIKNIYGNYNNSRIT